MYTIVYSNPEWGSIFHNLQYICTIAILLSTFVMEGHHFNSFFLAQGSTKPPTDTPVVPASDLINNLLVMTIKPRWGDNIQAESTKKKYEDGK